jgi:MSHA biogenesis protein MshG
MATFEYKGRNDQGEVVSGQFEAESTSETASHLFNIGITPIEITAAQEKPASFIETVSDSLFSRPPDLNEMIMFSRQMSTLLHAGISILPALRGLGVHMTHKGLAQTLKELAADLESGRSLAGSMQQHPHIFSTLFASMINVGENTGQLDRAFTQIYQYLEIDKQTRERIKTATRYPIFVMVAMVIAILVINLFVIPAFAKVFASFGSDLPWATQILMTTSTFMINFWHIMLLAAVGSWFGIKYYVGTEQGMYRWDQYKLRIPIIGSIIERATLARFARAFSMAFRAGVPITQTLSIVSKAVDNTYIEKRILSMRNGLEHGESLTQTAVASNLFTPLVLQMISVGEQTGAVDDMLDEVANFYEKEVDYDTNQLSSAIEPILIAVIGAMVLVLALGVFLPMWDLAGAAFGR